MANPSNLEGLDEDPRALGKMMRQMSSELGEDMGSEFNEVVSRLESGQNPEQIERIFLIWPMLPVWIVLAGKILIRFTDCLIFVEVLQKT